MSDIVSVIVAFFAALGMVSLVWIVFAALSAPEQGSTLYLLSGSLAAPDIEADLRRAAWISRTGGVHVTLLLPENALSEAELRLARHMSRQGTLTLASHNALEFSLGNVYERNT